MTTQPVQPHSAFHPFQVRKPSEIRYFFYNLGSPTCDSTTFNNLWAKIIATAPFSSVEWVGNPQEPATLTDKRVLLLCEKRVPRGALFFKGSSLHRKPPFERLLTIGILAFSCLPVAKEWLDKLLETADQFAGVFKADGIRVLIPCALPSEEFDPLLGSYLQRKAFSPSLGNTLFPCAYFKRFPSTPPPLPPAVPPPSLPAAPLSLPFSYPGQLVAALGNPNSPVSKMVLVRRKSDPQPKQGQILFQKDLPVAFRVMGSKRYEDLESLVVEEQPRYLLPRAMKSPETGEYLAKNFLPSAIRYFRLRYPNFNPQKEEFEALTLAPLPDQGSPPARKRARA